MSKVNPIPAGFHSVTPFLYVKNAKQFIEFAQAAFGAQETVYHDLPNNQAHAEIKIGDSMLMIGQTTPAPASIYLYVHDVDATYARAVEAGATSMGAPSDKPYGDRNATVIDAHGITWFIGSRIEDDEVIARRMKTGKSS